MADMFAAKESFFAVIDGERVMVHKNRDLVAAGHPLLTKYPAMFKPAHVRFDVEQATANPGEKRGEPASAPLGEPYPRHVGGGWYEAPDGERFHGRQAADDYMESTDLT